MNATGTCTVQQLETGHLRVLEADPRVWISVELLEQISANPHPDVSLIDDVLTINAVNRRVIYRIHRDQTSGADHWVLGEWPD